ncbi:MAG: ribonuclease P protein component [Thermaurantimonas sp.]
MKNATTDAVVNYRLQKSEIIRKKSVFDALFSNGRSAVFFPIKVIWTHHPEWGVAFSVPKKNFRKAHDRNRIKRLLREGYRLNKNLLPVHNKNLALLFIYIGKKQPFWSEIDTAFKKMAQELPAKL